MNCRRGTGAFIWIYYKVARKASWDGHHVCTNVCMYYYIYLYRGPCTGWVEFVTLKEHESQDHLDPASCPRTWMLLHMLSASQGCENFRARKIRSMGWSLSSLPGRLRKSRPSIGWRTDLMTKPDVLKNLGQPENFRLRIPGSCKHPVIIRVLRSPVHFPSIALVEEQPRCRASPDH